MAKDVRIEILYFKTPADVSLEFGLHGDYPLRLLSSSCNTISEFFTSFKRAVSRSEIIITVGGYGEDNLPAFIAKAIGQKCVMPNLRNQKIIAQTTYILPEKAVPLAPKSRVFGGFLIESGPQTIISLIDDKTTRLDIVNQFLVDYITEHHAYFNSSNAIYFQENDIEEAIDEAIEDCDGNNSDFSEDIPALTIVTDAESNISADNSLEEAQLTDDLSDTNPNPNSNSDSNSESESESEFEFEPETKAESDNEDKEPESSNEPILPDSEPENGDDITNESQISDNTIELDDAEYDDTEESNDNYDEYDDDFVEVIKNSSVNRKNRIFRILCIVFSALVLLGTLFSLWYFPKSPKTDPLQVDYYSSMQSKFNSLKDNLSLAFDSVKKDDNSIFTWLTIENTDVSYPVNTVANLDSFESCLNTLPNGIADSRGMLFSITDTRITDYNKNTVIYGNAAQNGLLQVFSADFGKLSQCAVNTVDKHFSLQWKVLSTFTHSKADGFDYAQTDFDSNESYIDYLTRIDELSDNPTLQSFYGNERLLIIVGVTDNERYIAVAMLSSISILSTPDYNITSSIESGTSSGETSSNTSSDESDYSESTEDKNDFFGDTPDIILPSIPTTSNTTSTNPSSVSSSNNTTSVASTASEKSSDTAASTPPTDSSSGSSGTSSDSTSAQPSSPSSADSSVQSQPSSSSTSVSSAVSSVTSSTVTPKPDIDPIFTWDVMVAVKSTGPDRKGEVIVGTATEVVAYIIEIEMSPTIHPPEALIAQAIVKYNWIINNGGRCSVNENGEVIPPAKPPENAMQTPTPQALQYANAAKGMVLIYGNTLAKTYCHDTSAGFTAAYHNIWGGGNYPYLQGVECPVDKEVKNYEVTTTYTSDEIKSVLELLKANNSSFSNIDIDNTPKDQWIVPTEYDNNNAYCTKVSICGVVKNGTFLRSSVLTKTNTGKSTIRSSAYTVTYSEETDTFTVTTKGYGHGVGLSQQGAILYAKQGWTAEQILSHFFPGTTLLKN